MSADLTRQVLGKIIGSNVVTNEIVDYVTSIESKEDFDEYFKNLINTKNGEHVRLYKILKKDKFANQVKQHKQSSQPAVKFAEEKAQAINDQIKNKKAKNYIKFTLAEQQKGLLRNGRIPCDCESRVHRLINNCLDCGRIVCEQEGSGNCFFCGALVVTQEEQEILQANNKHSDALVRVLNERKKSEEWKKALEQRDKLLRYDKNFETNAVIDDQTDYFDVNSTWLREEDREELKNKLAEHKKMHENSRRNKTFEITLDLFRRKMYEESGIPPQSSPNMLNQQVPDQFYTNDYVDDDDDDESAACVPDVETLLASLKEAESNWTNIEKLGIVDDRYSSSEETKFTNYHDKGLCLSMHQPWASLLVAGIKKHEGRAWSTDYRGILWIASTVKEPHDEDIKDCKTFYRNYYEETTIIFPENYPTGSLLGYVIITDCLSQNDYSNIYENGESMSQYVFICINPVMLPVPLPVKGRDKIYKLDSKVHKSACLALDLKNSTVL